MSALTDLLTDWMEASASVIWEHSGNISRDLSRLIEQAKERAAELGIDWDDDLIPDSLEEYK